MTLYDIIFYFFAVVTVGSATVVVFARNIVYSAFALLFTFFGVAGLYVLLNADFLAVTQLLIYVGGILVLLLFGVMLTSNSVSIDVKTGTLNVLPAVIVISLLAGLLGGMFWTSDWFVGKRASEVITQTTTRDIGTALITTHVLLFEIASVILLIAIVGAAMMARRENSESQSPNLN